VALNRKAKMKRFACQGARDDEISRRGQYFRWEGGKSREVGWARAFKGGIRGTKGLHFKQQDGS